MGGNTIPGSPQSPVDNRKQLTGIDIYHGDGTIPWSTLTNVDFVFHKATEGSTHVDSAFEKNREAAKKQGIPFGAYHFFKSTSPPESQALNFLKVIGDIRIGELPPVLDWEDRAITDVKMGAIFLDIVEKETGVMPILYCGASFGAELNFPARFSRYPLWLAHYTVGGKPPKVPSPWSDYTFWQFCEADDNHEYDTNYFNGGIAELEKLMKK